MLHDRDHILTLLTEAILARSNKGYSLGTCAAVAETTLQNYDRSKRCVTCSRAPAEICRTCGAGRRD